MHSKGVCGLQPQPLHHNVSQVWALHPNLPKNHPGPPTALHRYYSVRMHPYVHPQKLYVHIKNVERGMQSMGVCSLNHGTTLSFGLSYHTQIFQEITPTRRYKNKGVWWFPFPITLYTSNIDLGCSQWRHTASNHDMSAPFPCSTDPN